MTTLVTGAGGQLGRALGRTVAPTSDLVALTRAELDVTDRDQVLEALTVHRPVVVVNCAAWTDVDGCELDERRARRINLEPLEFLREACESVGSHLVQISTDFVFDGELNEPYTEAHGTGPLNIYGAGKLESELAAGPEATVIRTSWLQDSVGPNMVERVFRSLNGSGRMELPGDRWSTPSFTDDVARVVSELANQRYPGVVHVANEGVTSWTDFARALADELGHDPERIVATFEEDLNPPRPARRPAYSALSNAVLRDLGYQPMRHHRDVAGEILGRLRDG